jgi:hypothetical protein
MVSKIAKYLSDIRNEGMGPKTMRAPFSIVCLLITVFLRPITASARDCGSATFELAAARSPIVVRGRPVVTRHDIAVGQIPFGFTVTLFAVQSVWKGDLPSTVHLYQPRGLHSVDMTQYTGVDFMVFAQELTQELSNAFLPPRDIVALLMNYCVSKPTREGSVARLGPSRPPSDVRPPPVVLPGLPDLPPGPGKR